MEAFQYHAPEPESMLSTFAVLIVSGVQLTLSNEQGTASEDRRRPTWPSGMVQVWTIPYSTVVLRT